VTQPQQPQSFYRKIPGQAFLWAAVAIFGASSAVTRRLTEIGAQHFMDGSNPISLCNVLFVGNLCALLVLVTIHWRQLNRSTLGRLSGKEWTGLFLVAFLSGALAPGLIFQALSQTAVNNVVLVGRIEPPLTLALSVWMLRERVNGWEVTGAIAAFIGVTLTIVLQPPSTTMVHMGSFHLGLGELLAVSGAIALATATIIGKKRLGRVPLGFYSIFRTAVGTVVFFITALVIYGRDHFMDAFSPFLWQWMLAYGAVIVVVGQSFWLTGLRASTVSVASLVASFTPIAGIVSAYFILGEAPTKAQYVGSSVILVGIFLSQIGIQNKIKIKNKNSVQGTRGGAKSTLIEQNLETQMGFKGI
jgi:drug/metabolite transporter (DMT)-like permease